LAGEALAAAIPHARRWLALDPLLEAPHRALMRLYARTGQRNAALRQYQACVRLLAEELNVEPAEETTALYERIRQGQEYVPSSPTGPENGTPPAEPSHEPSASPPSGEIRPVTVLLVGLSQTTETLWDLAPEDMAAATTTLRQI